MRRVMVGARAAYELSERLVCRTSSVARSSIQYHSVRPRQEAHRRRIHELAGIRERSADQQTHVEGWPINHKRVYRLYTEERLTLK